MIDFGSQDRKEEDLRSNVGVSWGDWWGSGGHLVNLNENPARFLMPKERSGTKSRVRGGTREAPRRHQGGLSEAPSDRECIGRCFEHQLTRSMYVFLQLVGLKVNMLKNHWFS